jgi:hypothetical protein
MSRFVMPSETGWPKIVISVGPNGISAIAVSASDSARNGARK